MSRLRWDILMTALCLAVVPAAVFGQETALTLREAIDQALRQNPREQIAHANVEAASAAISLARTGLLPNFNFVEDLSRGNDPVYVFGTKLRQQRFTQSDFSLDSLNRPTPTGNFATRITGSWMLFDGLVTEDHLRGANLAAKSTASITAAIHQGIVLQVVQDYQAVLYTQRGVDIAQHEEQTAESLVHEAQTRVKAGLNVDSDLLAAQVNLAERQQERIAAEGNLENAWTELETAMGSEATMHPALQPLEAKTFPEGVLADDLAAALKARPDLQALRLRSDAQQKAVHADKAAFLPQVSAYGSWETDRPTFAGNGGNNWVAGVQLSIDVLPIAKRAHLREEQAAQQTADAEERSSELQIRLAVHRAFTGQLTAARMVATARAAMDQSSEELRILRNRYDAGLVTINDLLRAEDAQRQSQTDYWHAAYGNTVAYAELLYAAGELTPDSAESLQ
ncbi:MAG: TolC family protein [Acidobacteriaceae bacterium]